ncbi:N-acetylmuramoyl-L-alanine amidase [Desulfotomaculum arcticum]|uniref:Spore cortex-lytic enzyme n=2 Tax=Desulfotruncus TaxID=2867377 RepID=A0A1I2VF73_9FIRM|nr:N-acetylmuramoyl-L-alanine amidase [Desulfotomaculum arcticum] [Desulfotruncus arcticus DSM 17038]
MYKRKIITRMLPLLLMALLVLTTFMVTLNDGKAYAQKKTLFWGSSGNDVYALQQKLRQWGYYKGLADGTYGSSTYKAVTDFQRKNGLRADGVVGPSTWSALGYSDTADKLATKSDSTVADRGFVEESRDIALLARVIEGEASDEAYFGKVAVGAVILNRVRSSAFPDTIAGVIFQPRAFESVANGQVNRPLTKDSLRAAREAMAGSDPSGGATFFWNPSKDVSPWIWSRRVITTIGRHVFAR